MINTAQSFLCTMASIVRFMTIVWLSLGSWYGVCDETSWENSLYFDTAFLQNSSLVRQRLIDQEGFQEVHFITQDDIELAGLMLLRPEARYTVISCAGFYPGKKEGMATLFHLLPADCNLLFFDARGHGQSEGPFKRTIAHYGKHEYKDIIAAVRYMHAQEGQVDIIIHSICAGSFHAIHALHALENSNDETARCVKGLIFDSGFASLLATMDQVYMHTRTKVLPACLTSTVYYHDTKDTVQDRYIYKALWAVLYSGLKAVDIIVRPIIKQHESRTNLFTIISRIKTPILYIHAIEDTYASVQDTQQLAANTQNKECWWVENSAHTVNHLKHKYAYREKLISFIERVCQRS